MGYADRISADVDHARDRAWDDQADGWAMYDEQLAEARADARIELSDPYSLRDALFFGTECPAADLAADRDVTIKVLSKPLMIVDALLVAVTLPPEQALLVIDDCREALIEAIAERSLGGGK